MFEKILVLGIPDAALPASKWKQISSLGRLFVSLPKNAPNFLEELSNADCVLGGFGFELNAEQIKNSPKLQYIGVMATAFGKVDVEAAKHKGIIVTNLPGYSTESVAEFTFAVLLSHMRSLAAGIDRAENKNYSEAGMIASEIRGKNFGIIGLGRIGRRVAELALAFGANVSYWSKTRKQHFEDKGCNYQDLDKLISSNDIVSINIAQTPETENLLSSDRCMSIKVGAIVINSSPNEIVEFQGVCSRLKNGDITYVFDHSDEMSESLLEVISQFSNCTIYPPIANISAEAQQAKQEMFIDNISAFLDGKSVNVVYDLQLS